jgi:hypothetical protein
MLVQQHGMAPLDIVFKLSSRRNDWNRTHPYFVISLLRTLISCSRFFNRKRPCITFWGLLLQQRQLACAAALGYKASSSHVGEKLVRVGVQSDLPHRSDGRDHRERGEHDGDGRVEPEHEALLGWLERQVVEHRGHGEVERQEPERADERVHVPEEGHHCRDGGGERDGHGAGRQPRRDVPRGVLRQPGVRAEALQHLVRRLQVHHGHRGELQQREELGDEEEPLRDHGPAVHHEVAQQDALRLVAERPVPGDGHAEEGRHHHGVAQAQTLEHLARHRRRHGRLDLGDDAVAERRGDDGEGVEHAERTVLGVPADGVVLRGRPVRGSCHVAPHFHMMKWCCC